MGLYDRDYISKQSSHEFEQEAYQGRVSSFIKDTYKLIGASLVAATAGAYIGMQVLSFYSPILFLIVELAILFGMNYAVKKEQNTIALILLFVFTFITGFTLGPILNMYLGMGAGHVVTQAFLVTAIAFGGLTVYAMNTQTDFSSWGKPMFYALIGIIIASLLNMFLFKSTMGSLIISSITAILFCGYILYDTQNIIKGRYDSPIMAAVSMYLNILNLFISLLNILGITNRE
ncbi:Bax inhibitor-1/YccA family protein [Campylobacter geochelonis]|uniref:Bax inhibitor-1/YccA family protein n=1 Tax=Campylobacter geochelonis TaxID=1780362 RepID=UPI000770786B|nr:Bax inhibitor-1/YccA family protein [Campylobacter geochelonis]CZE46199.1 ferric receptor CfrA [Campylobacter geochelonis]